MSRKIVATDFDGVLCEDKYPDIGAPHEELIKWLIDYQAQGNAVILWTCRSNKALERAVEFCEGYGLRFDAVNENIPETIERYGDGRKVFAHWYLDDRAAIKQNFNIPYHPDRKSVLPETKKKEVVDTKPQTIQIV